MTGPTDEPAVYGWHLSVALAGAHLSLLVPGTTRALCPRSVARGLALAAVAVLADGCRRGYWRRPARLLPAPQGVVTWRQGDGTVEQVAHFGPVVLGLYGGTREAWGELLRLTVRGLYDGSLRPVWGDDAGGHYVWSAGGLVGEA